MKRAWIAAALLLLASEAFSQSRRDPTGMACAQVQAMIAREGVVILRYASSSILGLPLYDRYVGGREFCGSGEVVRTTGIPTADQRYCPVQKCVQSDIFVDE